MNAHSHKIKRPRKRKDRFSSLVVFLLIGSMIFYQLLPLSIAIAEETVPAADIESPAPPEEEPAPEPPKEETPPTEEPEETQVAAEEVIAPAESLPEEPAEIPTEVTMENTNTAAVENDAAVVSNTGENTAGVDIGDESDPCEKDEQAENPEGSAEALSEENNSGEETPSECPADDEEASPVIEETALETEEAPLVEEAASVLPPASTSPGGLPENSTPEENNEEESQEGDKAEENAEVVLNQEPIDPANQLYGGADYPEPVTEQTTDLSEESAAEIQTGDALAVVNIANDLNVNLLGSNWENLVLNIEGDLNEDINLYLKFLAIAEESVQNGEPENSEGPLQTEIINDNQAEITNNVTVLANTGENKALAEGADAAIQTGNAVASANIVNLVNRNLVGSNWLFAVINIFGNLFGNIIVPGEGLFTLPGSGCSEGCLGSFNGVLNSNSAEINNSVVVGASTGENTAESEEGSASIVTGEAVAAAEVKNIANTNIVGSNNWFFLLINNMGKWSGQVLNWNAEDNSLGAAYSYAFEGNGPASPPASPNRGESLGGSDNPAAGVFSVENQNVAKITNNVTALATTGGNAAKSQEGSTSIETGDATALAKIVNFVNTNITGNNWFFGMVNILGNWEGDLEFAYPDLEVSISDGQDSAGAGDTLVYKIKYKNAGEAVAENVRLRSSFASHLSESERDWNIGSLGPGEEGSYEVEVEIDDPMPEGVTVLESAAGIVTDTKEPEGGNNTSADRTSVRYASSENGGGSDFVFQSGLAVKRSANGGRFYPGSTVHHEIIVKNDGDGPIYGAEVQDKVMTGDGLYLGTLVWDIGNMNEGERIMITYDLLISDATIPGSYTYSATAQGEDYYGDEVESHKSDIILGIGRLLGGRALAGDETDAAQAATEVTGTVLGEEFPLERGFPLWIWMLAAVAYYLAINWSLFPRRQRV